MFTSSPLAQHRSQRERHSVSSKISLCGLALSPLLWGGSSCFKRWGKEYRGLGAHSGAPPTYPSPTWEPGPRWNQDKVPKPEWGRGSEQVGK